MLYVRVTIFNCSCYNISYRYVLIVKSITGQHGDRWVWQLQEPCHNPLKVDDYYYQQQY